MRTRAEIDRVVDLAGSGLNKSAIARATGIPRSTVRDWLSGRLPHLADDGPPVVPPGPYAYLLGLYLGDGFIARGRRAWCLRIYFDARQPGIIGECVRAVRAVRPDNRVRARRRVPAQCVVVECWSAQWPRLLPQHGAGLKHSRLIALADWQRTITYEHPQLLIRGLLHSDGSRFLNSVRHGTREYVYPRYTFTNRSEDIKAIFCEHLDLLGIAWRRASDRNISVARRDAVAALDGFVGPKR
jgi:hypothetical protein